VQLLHRPATAAPASALVYVPAISDTVIDGDVVVFTPVGLAAFRFRPALFAGVRSEMWHCCGSRWATWHFST
jgi:hypothetical protein